MTTPPYDVLGIGNAIVDVLAHADDGFLEAHKIRKGGMTLIDAGRAETLYGAMGPAVEVSGGSVANTMAGIASLGGKAAYIGKVRDDQLGAVFSHDIKSAGVDFATPASRAGAATARCLIVVTPDAQRSMSTYLGACVELAPEDVTAEQVEAAAVTFLEGYLFDPPLLAAEAFYKAANLAHRAGRQVALTLSDPLCVERHRDGFRYLITHEVDVLLANEAEIKSLYQEATFDGALQRVRRDCQVAALTRSEKGSVIVSGEDVHVIDPVPVNPVDSTGAGDLYAAGLLYGYVRGFPLADCGRLGSLAAAEVIGHYGARPETSLRELAQKNGLPV